MTSTDIDDSIFQANMQCLADHRPELFKLPQSVSPPGEMFATNQGLINMRYTAAGYKQLGACAQNEDPWQDASEHLNIIPDDSNDLTVFIGIGLGYAPLLIMRERPQVAMLVIVEPDVSMFAAALRALDLRPLIISAQVEFFIGTINYASFENKVQRLAALEDTHVLRHPASFIQRPQLYKQCNDETYGLLNKINVAGSTIKKYGSVFLKNRLTNLALLPHSYSLDCLRDLFKGVPAVLVAAGPSLSHSLNDLTKMKDHCLIIAVDSALAPLLTAGITPDFVTSIDYQDLNFEKLAPFMDRDWPFSLVSLANITPLITKRFPCRNLFIGLQESQSDLWLLKALGIKTLAPDAFSVAHFSHGLAKIMGAGPIIFIGQDLAFTSSESDHAQGVILHSAGLPSDREFFQIEGLDNTTVQTDRQLLSLLRLLEENIAADNQSTYFNASAFGAVIKGTSRAHLDELAKEYYCQEIRAEEKIDKAISKGKLKLDNFIKEAKRIEGQCQNIGTKITRLIGNGRKLIKDCAAINTRPYKSLADLPQALINRLSKFDGLNNEVDNQESFWQQIAELTFNLLAINDRQRLKNDRIKHEQGYMTWLTAELKRINTVNTRRLEAVKDYQNHLRGLLTDLRQGEMLRKKLSQRPGPETAFPLLHHYLNNGQVSAAANLINLFPEDLSKQFFPAKWLIKILRLDYKGALNMTESGQNAGEPDEWALRLRRLELSRWINHILKLCAPDAEAFVLSMLPIWLGRIVSLCDKSIPEEILRLWHKRLPALRQLLNQQDNQSALSELQAWEPLTSYIPELTIMKAESCARRNIPGMSPVEVEDFLRRNLNNIAVQAAAALYFIHSGFPERGVTLLSEVVSQDPTYGYLWAELGDELLNDDDPQSALAAFEKAFLALPKDYDMLIKMGDCYQRLDLKEAACAAYEAVLQKKPHDSNAKTALSLL